VLSKYIAILVLLTATGLDAAKTPKWVKNRPAVAGHYVGIGVATRSGDLAADRETATQNALNDIATQIEVSISSAIETEETEDAYGISQAYSAQIKTMVSTDLAGVEIVKTWKGKKEFWVYARLSEQKFAELRQQKIDDARRLAFELFVQAEKKMPGQIAAALPLYLQALRPLGEGLGDPLSVEYQGGKLNLDTAIPARIRDLLAAIALRPAAIVGDLKRGTGIDVPVEIRAVYGSPGAPSLPVADLPLALAFTRGSGQLVEQIRSAADGRAVSRLTRIEGAEPVQTIRARIDLSALLPADAADLPLDRFTAPFIDIELTVSRQRIYVQSSELNLGQSLQVPVLEPVVKRLLADRGVEFAATAERADVVVRIKAETRRGNRFQNIHFSLLDLTLSLHRQADGAELFKTALTGVKGSGADFQQAGVKAFSKAARDFEEGILAEALDRL
jgi:hypothetical protein